MPRVVQVPSETEEVNVYNADSSESEDTVNRNFNQTVNFLSESVTTYMRFPINYSLYNVTYLDSENDPYCLRCEIDGQVKKFKKDARTWLHKSSDRKRKFGDETTNRNDSTGSDDNATANKNLKLISDAEELITFGGTYRSGPYNYTEVNNDLLSEISSLGDSEADLTYSEESSPSVGSETQEQYQKSVRFDDTAHTGYRTHSIPSDSDESFNVVGKTTSSRNIVFQDELMEVNDNNICTGNESRNNIRPGPMTLEVSRLAPAISIEIESLQESLLDNAVNLNSKLHSDSTLYDSRPLSKDAKNNKMRKMNYKKRRQANGKSYSLRSMKKVDLSMKDWGTDQVPSLSKYSSQRDAYFKTVDVKPAAANMDLAHPRQVVCSDQIPSCSQDDENGSECSSVPKLFVLAGQMLYKHLKSEFDKSI